jgi:prepilin-type processing-associated H-X9-DG protein
MHTAFAQIPPTLFGRANSSLHARSKARMRRGLTVSGLMLIVAGSAVLTHHGVVALQVDRRERCVGHLRRIGVALLSYHDRQGHFPAAAITDSAGRPLLSWRVAILPELGRRDLFDRFKLNEPWDSPHNRALIPLMPEGFACPSEPRTPGATSYEVVAGPPGAFSGAKPLFDKARGVDIREVLDGGSNTLMVAETARPMPWTMPSALYFEEDQPLPRFASRHPKGFNVLFADGSARFVHDRVDDRLLRALITRDGGEVSGG